MVKKVLPPLNEQNQVPNIATSGEWKVEDASFLEKLAEEIPEIDFAWMGGNKPLNKIKVHIIIKYNTYT